MNKDVVYIEPDDDITDIITKIENAKEKIVAIVPPKKATVLRSIVNIKLMAKAGAAAGKTVVLVTTDPSIVKLAAATKLPVTKNLQTPPEVPTAEEEVEETTTEAVIEGEDGEIETTAEETEVEAAEGDSEALEEALEAEELSEEDSEEEAEEEDASEAEEGAEEKKGRKAKKEAKRASRARSVASGPIKPFSKDWFLKYWKILTGAGCGVIVLIIVLVWMFAIAPAVKVDLKIRTTTANFSENVSFTEKLEEENSETGKFYLTAHKIESKSTVEFEATGEKNVGEKATGTVTVYAYLPKKGGSTSVAAGATFTNKGLVFTADSAITLSWGGSNLTECENHDDLSIMDGCIISGKVNVTATGSGANYNIAATNSGWSTNAGVNVRSSSEMAGGTDKMVTVVTQADVDKAMTEVKSANAAVKKAELIEAITETNADVFIVESSFEQTTGEATVTPKVGEEVKEGEKAKLEVVTTDSVYSIDKTKVEEFIMAKAKLAENYKIYSMNDPFIENFSKGESGMTGKLKTSYVAGPKVTATEVIEMVRGKGVGTATAELSGMNGIGSVTITTSFPWVHTVPNDVEKITVNIDTGEEQR